jgi:uncharacterized membrane protein
MALALALIIAIAWYQFAAGGAVLSDFVQFSSTTAQSMIQDFLSPASRPTVVLQAIGIGAFSPGLLHYIGRVANYAVLAFILLGFAIFVKRAHTFTEKTMVGPMIASMVMLVAATVLPFFASGLNFSRVFQLSLLFIAPCFAIGARVVDSAIRRCWAFMNSRPGHFQIHVPSIRISKSLLAVIVLVSYFLFTSGWTWAVTMDTPISPILDLQRMMNSQDPSTVLGYYNRYTYPQDAQAALWLRAHITTNGEVCADFTTRNHVLDSYGQFPRLGPALPEFCSDPQLYYIFLSVLNTQHNLGTESANFIPWNITDVSPIYVSRNRIYSNGGSVIFGLPS